MKNLAQFCSPHSDMSVESLEFLRESCQLAHEKKPGGLSIEIGSRKGGSALLTLIMLQELYPDVSERPMLFTVDPYGGKPYKGGDAVVPGLYTDVEYVAIKKLLAPFPNHAHWYMEGLDFLIAARVLTYWQNGFNRSVDGISFALLDGDHDHKTIHAELFRLLPLMSTDGIIVVDNVDKDPLTAGILSRYKTVHKGPAASPGNSMVRLHCSEIV